MSFQSNSYMESFLSLLIKGKLHLRARQVGKRHSSSTLRIYQNRNKLQIKHRYKD